jgi:branched-chain amino acid transport system substrate-binding protein
MKNFKLMLVIILAFFLVVTLCFPAWGARKIKIGVIGPMQFVQGKGHWNGAVMAAEEINAKGGVKVGDKKMMIELVKADSNEFLNVTDATNAMERLWFQKRGGACHAGYRHGLQKDFYRVRRCSSRTLYTGSQRL